MVSIQPWIEAITTVEWLLGASMVAAGKNGLRYVGSTLSSMRGLRNDSEADDDTEGDDTQSGIKMDSDASRGRVSDVESEGNDQTGSVGK